MKLNKPTAPCFDCQQTNWQIVNPEANEEDDGDFTIQISEDPDVPDVLIDLWECKTCGTVVMRSRR